MAEHIIVSTIGMGVSMGAFAVIAVSGGLLLFFIEKNIDRKDAH